MNSFQKFFEECVVEEKRLRFSNAIDARSEAFENELVKKQYRSIDGRVTRPIEISLYQSHDWLSVAQFDYRILQIESEPTHEPNAQFVVRIERPRRLKNFGRAFLSGYSLQSVDGKTEEMGLRWLQGRLKQERSIIDFRLQPYQLDRRGLHDFHARARRAGFRLVDQQGVTRTLVLDLRPSMDDLLKQLSSKTRVKLKKKYCEMFDLRDLTDSSMIERCQSALDASMNRTGAHKGYFDFRTLFSIRAKRPDRAKMIGLYLKHRPEEMLAFVSAFSHGRVVEYSAAGSFADAELRKIPFNYLLVWELMKWGKSIGAEFFDMGGVTDGDAADRLAGISEFKRNFTESEHDIGRESYAVLRPIKHWVFNTLTKRTA